VALPAFATIARLNDLIFYSVDKASPYALAQHDATNTLGEIADLSLIKLGIGDQDAAIMWLWLNAHSAQYGAAPVSPKVAGNAETVADVIKAVYDTI
jgi:hypothetical protein